MILSQPRVSSGGAVSWHSRADESPGFNARARVGTGLPVTLVSLALAAGMMLLW